MAAVLGLLAIVLHLTLADRPWQGWSAGGSVSAGALALFAAWVLASSQWSGSAARALVEFDRALLYLAVLVLFVLFATSGRDLGTLLRWVAGVMCVVCVAALATRLAPGTFPTSRDIANDRLTFPLTYWNAMGILSALAMILALHVSSSSREPAVARVLAAAAIPAVAVALYFTFSRGGIAAAILGITLYMLVGHPRGLLPALLAVAPPTAYALAQAYGADLLATTRFSGSAAAAQRHEVLVAVVLCVLLAGALRAAGLLLDQRLDRVRLARRASSATKLATGALVLVALAGVAVAARLPQRIDRERRAFSQGAILPGQADLRARLSQRGNNGRIANWRVALDGFEAEPLHGTGAGTYRLSWERERPAPPFQVTDGHSLYLEVASELGWPGLLLLVVALVTPIAVAVARLRLPERHATAAFLAAGGTLLLHAGIDWDWEMPALFIWYFAAGGVVLAAAPGRPFPVPGRLTRLVAGLACLTLALSPALVFASQGPLNRSVQAFKREDCRTAIDRALESLEVLDSRPEPFEILAYCDARAGRPDLAMQAMQAASRRDPNNWQYAYGLAVTQALAGREPAAAARRSRMLNPLSDLARRLERVLSSQSPARRRRAAGRAAVPFE